MRNRTKAILSVLVLVAGVSMNLSLNGAQNQSQAVLDRTQVAAIVKELIVQEQHKTTVVREWTPNRSRHFARNSIMRSGFTETQWKCLNYLWTKESNWRSEAVSPTKDYGIPQRNMPNHTKAERKAFLSDPGKQIQWGLKYIEHRYASPCKAKAHSDRFGWY